MENKAISTSGITAAGMAPVKNTTSFRVRYPKDYQGVRAMPDGETQEVARDAAEYFANLGIGEIVDAESEAAATSAKEIIDLIAAADTIEALDALIAKDEARKTVMEAYKARKTALKK